MILSRRYWWALEYASEKHRDQFRKGGGPRPKVPYITHPIAVAALVLEFGGDEDQAIAALLHDVVEDCGVHPQTICDLFGDRVGRIVRNCSDCVSGGGAAKPPWKMRKSRYLADLSREKNADTPLVSACDKLHNMRCTTLDIECDGVERTMSKFRATPEDVLWYFSNLIAIYEHAVQRGVLPNRLLVALHYELTRMTGAIRPVKPILVEFRPAS